MFRHSYFFADLQIILPENGLVCKNFSDFYKKEKRKEGDSTVVGKLFSYLVRFLETDLTGGKSLYQMVGSNLSEIFAISSVKIEM